MKTKIYLIIISLLLLFTVFTIYNKSNIEKNANKYKNFKVNEFDKVTKIILSNREMKHIKIEKVENSWILNNKFPIRMHIFNNMKEALTKMEAIKPVSQAANDFVISELIENAIKVEIFKKDNKPSKIIFIGGPNYTSTASNMFLEIDGKASSRIYEVSIPGFRGYLTSRFPVNENEWRSKLIFDYTPNEIQQVEIKYFSEHGKKDLYISKNKQDFDLKIDQIKVPKDMINQKNLINYLLHFENQNIMTYMFSKPEDIHIKDSLFKHKKFAEISIVDNQGKQTELTIIDMPLNEESKKQFDDNGDPMKYDIDYKYLVFGKNDDWGVINNSKFGALYVDTDKLVLK